MAELFNHIFPHLDLEWIFANYGTSIYIILFLVIFVETGLVAMPFLPGDSLLFMAGLFARSGHLSMAYLLILLFIAAKGAKVRTKGTKRAMIIVLGPCVS